MQEKSKMFGKEEKDVFESLYNYASTKKKRQEQLSQKMYLTNLNLTPRFDKACTFSPNTNERKDKKSSTKKKRQKRSLENDWLQLTFLERQTIYSEYQK